jgi:hypothetical protein
VFGELSKNIELRYSCQPSIFAFFSPNRLHSFISLRGSKEPLGHRTRAKSLANRLIRTAQKLKKTKRPSRSRSTQPLNYPPSARTPQAPFNGSNLGLIRSAQTSRPVNRDPTLGLRSVFPNQSAKLTSQSIKREAVLLSTHQP